MFQTDVRSWTPAGAGLAAALAFTPLAGPLAAQASTQDEPPLRVAVVQLDAVALQSPAGQQLQARLVTFQEDVTAELQARQQAARAIEARVAQADSLTGEARRALEREYQDALTDFQRFQQDKQQEAQQMRAQGLARIQEEVAPVIEALQQEEGYDLVLNAQNSLVVIFSDRVDVTQRVIQRLQAEGASGGPGD